MNPEPVCCVRCGRSCSEHTGLFIASDTGRFYGRPLVPVCWDCGDAVAELAPAFADLIRSSS